MTQPGPVTVICTYRVASEHDDTFRDLLSKHWPTLHEQGLTTTTPPQFFRGLDNADAPFYVEIFEWADETAPSTAHNTPAVLAVWEGMGQCCEERLGLPAMEFPHVERIKLNG